MKNLLRVVFKLNLLFCAGVLVLDTYGKVCEMNKAVTEMNTAVIEMRDLLTKTI